MQAVPCAGASAPCRRGRRGGASGTAGTLGPAGAAHRPTRARRRPPAPRSCPAIKWCSGVGQAGVVKVLNLTYAAITSEAAGAESAHRLPLISPPPSGAQTFHSRSPAGRSSGQTGPSLCAGSSKSPAGHGQAQGSGGRTQRRPGMQQGPDEWHAQAHAAIAGAPAGLPHGTKRKTTMPQCSCTAAAAAAAAHLLIQLLRVPHDALTRHAQVLRWRGGRAHSRGAEQQGGARAWPYLCPPIQPTTNTAPASSASASPAQQSQYTCKAGKTHLRPPLLHPQRASLGKHVAACGAAESSLSRRPTCDPRFCISSVLSGTGAQRDLRAPSTEVTVARGAAVHSSCSIAATGWSNRRCVGHGDGKASSGGGEKGSRTIKAL